MNRVLRLVIGVCCLANSALAAPVSWDWQLSDPIDLSHRVAIMDVDPDSVSPAQVADLNRRGIMTICYVSVGTIEDYRDDVNAFPPEVVGNTYGDWPDERFLDIRRLDVLMPLMQARFQRCKDMGFDAVEPDNMDVYDNDSGFDLSVEDGVKYILSLADMAHGMGMQIGQKNVSHITHRLVGSFDFIITEGCFVDGWCEEVSAYRTAGKPILAAEYTDTDVNWAEACTYANANGVSMILKDRDLTAALQTCP